jgi:hypothetical protein
MGASQELANLFGEMTAAMNDGRLAWEGDAPLRGSVTLERRLLELLAA